MPFERDETRRFAATEADVLVQEQNGRAEHAVDQPTAQTLEVEPEARRRGPVEKEVNRVIGLAHGLLDHRQVRMEDAHAHLNVLVEIAREVALRVVVEDVGDAPVHVERTEKEKEGERGDEKHHRRASLVDDTRERSVQTVTVTFAIQSSMRKCC